MCSTVAAKCNTETQIKTRDRTVEHFPAQVAALQRGGLDPAHQAVVVHVPHGTLAQALRDQGVARLFVANVADLAVLILRSEVDGVGRNQGGNSIG